MKKQIHVLSGIILTLISLLTACLNREEKKARSTELTTTDINDTTFIKEIKWDSLNTFVDFHIIKNGMRTTDTNFNFIATPIAIYHYFNNRFKIINDTTKLNFKPNELKGFILSDSFSNRMHFDCLLKVNSQIVYQHKPDLLRTVTVRAKDMSDKNITRLITDFKNEVYSESVTSKVQKDTLLDITSESVFINIKLKPDYWDLNKIKEICEQLKERSDVDQAFFVDLYTGLNEGEMIYRLKTVNKSSR